MTQRHWQNLIYKKCPDCNIDMNEKGVGYDCPKCSFFITKTKFAEILTDPTHTAVRFLSGTERDILDGILSEVGIKKVDDYWSDGSKKW